MLFSAKIRQVRYVLCGLVRVMWHSWSLVRAAWRLDSRLCFVVLKFRGSYGKKIQLQSWADSFLFLRSRSDSFISPKSSLSKNMTSLVHVRLLSGVRRESSAIFEHKNVHSIFYSCLNFYLKKREGEFLATTVCPLATKNLNLIASWRRY